MATRDLEMPTISTSAYGTVSNVMIGTQTGDVAKMRVGSDSSSTFPGGIIPPPPTATVDDTETPFDTNAANNIRAAFVQRPVLSNNTLQHMAPAAALKQKEDKIMLRIVRVFLCDNDDRVPLASRLLYKSEELTTDATDSELYYEINVVDLLKKHNDFRATVEWEEKTADGTKTRTGLKPIRIRDLVMQVVQIANFPSKA